MLVLEPPAETPPGSVVHVVVAVVAHGQVVVGQQPHQSVGAVLWWGGKTPVSREAHTVICGSREGQLPPATQPRSMRSRGACSPLVRVGWLRRVAWPSWRPPVLGRSVGRPRVSKGGLGLAASGGMCW